MEALVYEGPRQVVVKETATAAATWATLSAEALRHFAGRLRAIKKAADSAAARTHTPRDEALTLPQCLTLKRVKQSGFLSDVMALPRGPRPRWHRRSEEN